MQLLVAGASGFLGRNFLREIAKEHKVVALYNQSKDFLDFLGREHLANVTPVGLDLGTVGTMKPFGSAGKRYDACLFLAANGDPAASVHDPIWDLQSNAGTLIQLLASVSIDHLVFLSSGAVYDGCIGPVTPETSVCPSLPYAVSKLAGEGYVRHFAKTSTIGSFTNVRFFGAYGPGEPPRKIYTRLVRRFAFDRDGRFTIVGDGNNLIDAMYVTDAVRALAALLIAPTELTRNKTIDVRSGKPLPIRELVEFAGKTFGIIPELTFEGQVPENIRFYSADETMSLSYGFAPEVSLVNGLESLASHLSGTLAF